MENNWKNKNFFIAFKNALNGIKYVFLSQRNLKIQLLFAIFAIIIAIILKCNYIEFSIIIIAIFIVLVTEHINTAIEKSIDIYTNEYNDNAKIAKDVAAGAVTLTSLMAIIIGCIIYLPKIMSLL